LAHLLSVPLYWKFQLFVDTRVSGEGSKAPSGVRLPRGIRARGKINLMTLRKAFRHRRFFVGNFPYRSKNSAMYRRSILNDILEALADTPVVFLRGARQTGKSTLVQAIAGGPHPARYVSLDNAGVLSAASADPAGFIAGIEKPVVIDEVQRRRRAWFESYITTILDRNIRDLAQIQSLFRMIPRELSRYSPSSFKRSHESNTPGQSHPDPHSPELPRNLLINGASGGGRNS
jgi:hypothetical protein